MKEIILKGSAHQRGLQHGKTFAKEIKQAYDIICRPMKEKWSKDEEKEKKKICYKLFKNTEDQFPGLAEELKGIAEGSNSDIENILLLQFYWGLGLITPQCTNLAFSNKERGAIHGKTEDIECFLHPFCLVETVYPDEGPSFISLGYVGQISGQGVNSIGLSCGISSGPTISGQDGRGIPDLILPRAILQRCSTVEEGIKFLSKFTGAGHGMNIFLADSQGNAAVVEKSYTEQAVRKIEDGVVWCTNYFLDNELAKNNFTRGEEGLKESKARYAYLQEVLGEVKVSHTAEEMKKILRNHKEPENGAICRHNSGNNKDVFTHWAAIFIPKEKRALITHGNPCEK